MSLFCTTCGSQDRTDWQFGGSLVLLILCVVASFLVLAGSIRLGIGAILFSGLYLLYCYAARSFNCAACGGKELIPADSPKAVEFQHRQRAFESVQERLPAQDLQEPITVRKIA